MFAELMSPPPRRNPSKAEETKLESSQSEPQSFCLFHWDISGPFKRSLPELKEEKNPIINQLSTEYLLDKHREWSLSRVVDLTRRNQSHAKKINKSHFAFLL